MGRLEKLADLARRMDVDGILLTSAVNMQYATMYGGLEGMVIVDREGRGTVFTDSRYIEDAEKKISPLGYQVIEPEGSYPTPGVIRDFAAERRYGTLAFEDMRMTVSEYETYKSCLTCGLVPLGEAVEALRQIKEPEEIQWITEAQRIAERALSRLLPEIRVGAYEDELRAKLRYYMAMEGSENFAPGMPLISGKKTSMPHGQSGHKALEKGDFITIDFGAEVHGYGSDMTRTFAVGSATEKMRHVYAVVLEAQAAGIDAFFAGKSGKEVDHAARSVIEKAGFGEYFGHGLGHSLGLEIHENPRANRTYEGIFQQGHIITVEPGIYIPGEFGVRIEDMIYLSPEGKVNLTEFPKELTILDA